jgi:putative membrane protein
MSDPPTPAEINTELARERNREAADRTLLAWIRSALSLIGFGFGIGKFYDYLQTAELHQTLDPIQSTRIFGGSFIILGVIGLLAAVIQHRRLLQRLERPAYAYQPPLPLGMFMAILLLIVGAFGFVAILL